MDKLFTKKEYERMRTEMLNVDKVDNDNYSLEFNDPVKFNENIYDKNGNIIPSFEVVEELPASPVEGVIYLIREV